MAKSAKVRVVHLSTSYISLRVFIGLTLVALGVSWIIGRNGFYGFHTRTAFALMFGSLFAAHGLLKKGHPYRVGKIGLVLGGLVLSYGVSSYY